MTKVRTFFYCQNCGQSSPKWLGKCPGCQAWNTFAEEQVHETDLDGADTYAFHGAPQILLDVEADESERMCSGSAEVDRVLGGGIVSGSAVLLGGDPGIGKSTLLLQILERLAAEGCKVLYVSGEESAKQIKIRARRIGALSPGLLVLVEVNLEFILRQIEELKPAVVVVDSIQTVYSSALTSAPGSVGQVRECSSRLILTAKKTGIPVFLVGHVTKDGAIAGPRVLEHMVDTVLYFEGDSGHAYRIVRSIKNRFGPAHEIGVFEMGESGLREVLNPSAFFLAERPREASGSVVVPSMEGTRPVLVEVQALVSPTSFGMPRRTAIGVDYNRVSLLVAVLEKICGYHLGTSDIYMNVAGGIKLTEPAVDLGVVSAIASSLLDRPIDPETVVFGEIGLTGEVRAIAQPGARIREAERMGFRRCLLPRTTGSGEEAAGALQLTRIGNLKELAEHLF